MEQRGALSGLPGEEKKDIMTHQKKHHTTAEFYRTAKKEGYFMTCMKRWMTLLTALMLLAAWIPAMAEDPAEPVPEGKQLMTLTLPDTEAMRDPNWKLLAHPINESSVSYLSLISDTLIRFAVFGGTNEAIAHAREDILEFLKMAGLNRAAEEIRKSETTREDRLILFSSVLQGLISDQMTWSVSENRTFTAVLDQQPTIFLLMNTDPETEALRGIALLADGEWVDLLPLTQTEEIWNYPDQILKILSGISPLVNPANYRTERLELPADGLETMTLAGTER